MSRVLEIRPGCFAHASGALWMEEQSTLIVADAHLGYGWAQRRRGQLGPVADQSTGRKLDAIIDELTPRTLVFLGDIVHAPRPGTGERQLVESILTSVAARVTVVLVRGNHDRGFLRDYSSLGMAIVDHHLVSGLAAIHGDRACPVSGPFIAGHLHPALGIVDDAGATQRVPVFLSGENGIILPAFSPFAAGYDIREGLPREIRGAIGEGPIDVIAASGRRVVRIGPLLQNS